MRATLLVAVPALALLATACTVDMDQSAEAPAAPQSGRPDWPTRAAETDLQRELGRTTEDPGTTATGTAFPTERLRRGGVAEPFSSTAGAGVRQGSRAGEMSAYDVRSRLESQGYTDVADLHREGDVYRATAMRDGRLVTLRIDPNTGRVIEAE